MFFKNISQGFIWTIKSRFNFISTAKFLSIFSKKNKPWYSNFSVNFVTYSYFLILNLLVVHVYYAEFCEFFCWINKNDLFHFIISILW